MVHRTRREQTVTKPPMMTTHHNTTHMSQVPPSNHLYPENGPPTCQCSSFLDPYPSTGQWRSGNAANNSALAHYCRVCNTQLNSCKQARIHVAGKKHDKRLAYLKFSLETGDQPQPQSQSFQSYQSTTVMPTGLPTVYAYPPPPGPAYYFPGGLQHYHYQQPSYHDYSPVNGQQSSQQTVNSSQPPSQSRQIRRTTVAESHGVMSPSLTSGFSGSGDCKSTETCSLLSVASYSSATVQRQENSNVTTNKSNPAHVEDQTRVSSETRHVVSCQTCRLPFPSRAVLEHHLIGSRHARKVKAESVLRQLQENGAEFRATQGTGDIRCEVCEVSVNSSHQLQAHMTGHKHKMRCSRQGVAPHRTILTPASSTAPSTTPSEASAPVRSQSILVGRPQFGSRPNLYHKTSLGDASGRTAGHSGVSGHRSSALANRVQKMRKIVRPRLKTESGARQRSGGILQGGPGGSQGTEGGAQATDSTTESDEPGTSKKTCQITILKKENNLDCTSKAAADESDEAKESEADQSECRTVDDLVIKHQTHARASQTEPLRRLSVDTGSQVQEEDVDEDKDEDRRDDSLSVGEPDQNGSHQQPRRRTQSATFDSQPASFQCNICQISLNSQSQVAQHMGSNKHRRLGAAIQTKNEMGSRYTRCRQFGSVAAVGGKENARDCNVREIPMLSMFLQRLHQHHYFPPIRDEEDANGTEETDR